VPAGPDFVRIPRDDEQIVGSGDRFVSVPFL
jgi:hypothetical protein